ncbi:MAG: DUF2975 domain-containing protein [Pseudomonadota bacterium]
MTPTKKIKIVTLPLLICCFGFLTYWLVREFLWLIPFAITDLTQWNNLHWVDDDVAIPFTLRAVFTGLWLAVIFLGAYGIICGARLLVLYFNGEYFSLRSYRSIQRLGIVMILSMVVEIFVVSINHSIHSWVNIELPWIEPSLYFQPFHLSLILSGCGFYVIGWVMLEAQKMKADLDEIL